MLLLASFADWENLFEREKSKATKRLESRRKTKQKFTENADNNDHDLDVNYIGG